LLKPGGKEAWPRPRRSSKSSECCILFDGEVDIKGKLYLLEPPVTYTTTPFRVFLFCSFQRYTIIILGMFMICWLDLEYKFVTVLAIWNSGDVYNLLTTSGIRIVFDWLKLRDLVWHGMLSYLFDDELGCSTFIFSENENTQHLFFDCMVSWTIFLFRFVAHKPRGILNILLDDRLVKTRKSMFKSIWANPL
jgi:hypothetical protein